MADREGLLLLKDGFCFRFIVVGRRVLGCYVRSRGGEVGHPVWGTVYPGNRWNTLWLYAVKWIDHHITTAYSPWANGIIERLNRELIRFVESTDE